MGKYSIQATSGLTGVGVHTLRAWEKRYSIVSPTRDDRGRRMYSEEEVELLSLLNRLIQYGNSIGLLAKKNIIELTELLNDFEKKIEKNSFNNIEPIKDGNINLEESLTRIILALEGYKLDIISHELSKLKLQANYKDLALNLFSPLFKKVGARVESGTFSIAQEHAISSIVKFHMGEILYRGVSAQRKNGFLIALATPEGDYHEFGILLSSLLCIHHKVKLFYLGPNLPVDSLIESANSINADAVLIGTTYIGGSQKINLDEYLGKTVRQLKSKQVWVGGDGAFNLSNFQKVDNFHFISTLNHLNDYLSGVSN